MITGVFAKPGSGKTIYLALRANLFDGDYVFSTSSIKGTLKAKFDDIAEKQLPLKSLILIDEITSYADNRDFKTTKKELIRYVTNHRHFGHEIVWCSQHFDSVDKKIRTNTETLYQVSMCGFFASGNSDRRPLLAWYANCPAFWSKLIGSIPFIRPRVRLKRYVPAVGYQRPFKGAFGQLVDGHDGPSEGLSGLFQRIMQPGYWVRKYTITQEALKSFDTHDDQISYLQRERIELVPW